jgi:hypothetical protein
VQVASRDAEARLHDAAVETFMDSPGGLPGAQTLDMVLGANSIDEAQDRLAFGDAVADAQVQIAGELLVAQTVAHHAHDVEALLAARRAMPRRAGGGPARADERARGRAGRRTRPTRRAPTSST